MNSLLLYNLGRVAPFVVVAASAALLLAHGVHLGVFDELGPGGPN